MDFGFIRRWFDGNLVFQLFLLILIICLLTCTVGAAEEYDIVNHMEVTLVYCVGDEITLGGRTNLAPGTALLVVVEEVAFGPVEKRDVEVFSGTSGTSVVQDDPPSFWTFSFSTLGWAPGTYLVTIEAPNTGLKKSVTISLLPCEEGTPVSASPSFTLASPSVMAKPVSPTPVTPSNAVPLSPVIVAGGCAAVFLFRRYFS